MVVEEVLELLVDEASINPGEGSWSKVGGGRIRG